MKRLHTPIKFPLHFEDLPFKLPRYKSVNYKQGFWLELVKDVIIKVSLRRKVLFSELRKLAHKSFASKFMGAAKERASFLYNFLFVEKSTVSKDALVVLKFLRRWLTTPLFLIALLTWVLWPTPTRTIYADPAPTPFGASLKVSMASKLPNTTLVPQEPVAAPAPPPPPPAPVYVAPVPVSTGGCVTGWVSGDYYLDKIVAFESGGRSCATNPGDCFGLLQACPGAPLRAACGGDPGCQIAWFQTYKTGGRSWAQVWQHELDYGWW